jgi:hypothetical protein
MEAWRLKMKALMVYRPVVAADSCHSEEELDPDPH